MPIDPEDSEVIREAIERRMLDVFTSTAGEVVVYDPVKQVADILCMVQRPYYVEGQLDYEEVAVLPNVPIQWPRAGGFYMHMPLAQGDTVSVFFPHDSIANWRQTAASSVPGDPQRHSFASAFAIPGLVPSTKPLVPDPLAALARAAGAVIGKDGGPEYIAFQTGSILLGQLAVMPVALAPPLLAYIAAAASATAAGASADTANSSFLTALAQALSDIQAALAAIGTALTPPNPAAATAISTSGASVGAATAAAAAAEAAATASAAAATAAAPAAASAPAAAATITKAQ